MGLKLHAPVPAAPPAPGELTRKVVAIDAPNLMYGFFAVRTRGEPTPEAREAAVRAATLGALERIADLAREGARSVLVLDGPPHPRKLALLSRRDAARQGPALTRADHAGLARLVEAMGAPVVRAPHDAEAQACAMARAGQVHVVATTDWDALAMGAPALLRHLATRDAWRLVASPDALAALGVSRGTLAAMAALMGCDYCEGFDGIGPKRALRLLQATTGADPLGEALARLDADDEAHEACREAARLMLEPPHAEVALAWRPPVVEDVREAAAALGLAPARLDRVTRTLAEAHATRTRQAKLA